MARPKNMMIDGKAVKSVKINGQLWWRKSTEAVEWRLEGIGDDTVYTYENYIDGTPLVLTVVNNTGIPSERYRIYDMEGNSPNELDVSFESDTCYITVTEWPKVNPLELMFTDDVGSGYEYHFILTLEPLSIFISPATINYNTNKDSFFTSFAVEGNIPIQNISWNTEESNHWFEIARNTSEDDGKRILFDVSATSYAPELTDGFIITVPIYAQGYQAGYKNKEATDELTINVTNLGPEYTYEMIENDIVYGAYQGDYWDATIYYLIQRNGDTVDQGEQYYRKSTNGQTPPFTDSYSIGTIYWDSETDQEISLSLSGTAYINN